MSLPAETQRTMESIYEDFKSFLSHADFSQAKECITHMSDYSPIEARRMQKELTGASMLDTVLAVVIVAVVVAILVSIFLWRTA